MAEESMNTGDALDDVVAKMILQYPYWTATDAKITQDDVLEPRSHACYVPRKPGSTTEFEDNVICWGFLTEEDLTTFRYNFARHVLKEME